MGEQTWNSWVGCLPPVYEFWFAWICNSLIFPFFGSSCLRASGKLILAFLWQAGPPWKWLSPRWTSQTSCTSGQAHQDTGPVLSGEGQPWCPGFSGKTLPPTLCFAFSGVSFSSCCVHQHTVNNWRKCVQLRLPTRHLYTNVKYTRATRGQKTINQSFFSVTFKNFFRQIKGKCYFKPICKL